MVKNTRTQQIWLNPIHNLEFSLHTNRRQNDSGDFKTYVSVKIRHWFFQTIRYFLYITCIDKGGGGNNVIFFVINRTFLHAQ